jgi:cellulose synthase (UDP-forming)
VNSRILAAGLIAALGLHYLVWRMGSSLNLSSKASTAISLTMLIAELLLLGSTFLQLLFSSLPGPDCRLEIDLAAETLAADRITAPQVIPKVAVLVPCCGEPKEVIERCLRGCLFLDYPNFEIWLLDDASRDELAELSRALGCHYLTRLQHNHAKAGNLNHALPHLQAELIAVFDADVVPLSNFLSRTAGLFKNPLVGFVQTPQTYMNADPVMRNLRLERWLMPDEESFYRWIQPDRQRLGAVVCAGTSFVMRCKSLEEIGGFETQTASEDLATGIRIIAAGYRGIYVPEKLSAGLAPFTIEAMARQRSRWASGTIQTLRTGANPLTIPGLNPLQRLAFLEGILHWCNVLPQLLLLLVPISIGIFGIFPYRIDTGGLLTAVMPFFLSQLILLPWLSNGSRGALMPELYRWVFILPLAEGVISTLLGHPKAFQVTPKTVSSEGMSGSQIRLIVPLMMILAIQFSSSINLLMHHSPDPSQAALDGLGRILALIWGLLNSLLLITAIRSCWNRSRTDTTPWFALNLEAVLKKSASCPGKPVMIKVISEQGCEFEPLDFKSFNLAIKEPDPHLYFTTDGLSETWPIKLIRREQRHGRERMGGSWAAIQEGQKEQLQIFLYRRKNLWPMRWAPFDGLAMLALLRRLLQRPCPEDWFSRSQVPVNSP